MRKVPIRQFQRNFYEEIKDLPVVVTIHDKKSFVVTNYREEGSVVTRKNKPKSRQPKKPSGVVDFSM